jgi:hypothetical protein
MNGPLARHYGIKGVDGEEFQRVTPAPSSARGVLTQAAILGCVVRDAHVAASPRQVGARESPGTPPPPPPPDVPPSGQRHRD